MVTPDERPVLPAIQVPYACASIPCDRAGFFDFPQRSQWAILYNEGAEEKWQRLLLIKQDGSDKSYNEKTAFLQSWLFFGALIEVLHIFGINITIDELLIDIDGLPMVSTGVLHRYGQLWISQEQQLDACGQDARRNKVLSILHEIETFASRWYIEPASYYKRSSEARNFRYEANAEIMFSIILLSRFLRLMVRKIYGSQYLTSTPAADDFFIVEQGILIYVSHRKLKAKRVCPSDFEMIRQRIHGAAAYFASFLERPNMLPFHQNCSKVRCEASQIDDATYRTRHAQSGDCNCPLLEVGGFHLASAIKRGRIPRIAISCQGDQPRNMSLSVCDDGPFIAISHVWSHGLGNPYRNGLPTCQLHRLSQYVIELGLMRDITSAPHLWIDTLCIPVEKEYEDCKRLAIQNLDAVYDQADSVLVVDAELQSFPLRESLINIGLQIALCTWCRRLWTLTEGSRAIKGGNSRLYFQLQGGAISYDEIRAIDPKDNQNGEDLYLSRGTCRMLNLRIPSFMRSAAAKRPRPIHRLYEMAAALSFRTTSRRSDEPIWIARLLELPTLSITSMKTAEERMRELYILVGDFPCRIIFSLSLTPSNYGDDSKLKISGYRWAPRSFLEDLPVMSRNLEEDDDLWATCTREGLRGTWCGFILESIEDAADTPFMMESEGLQRQYKIQCVPRPDRERMLWRESCLGWKSPPRGAILCDDIGPDHSFRLVLGTIVGEQGDVFVFRCLARGQNRTRVDAVSIVDDVVVETDGEDRYGDVRATMRRVQGTFVPLSKKWCIV